MYSLLKKYVHKTKDYEELVMCAKYGLVLAIYNFDLSYDTMFSTYAVPLILGEIKKYFKNNLRVFCFMEAAPRFELGVRVLQTHC